MRERATYDLVTVALSQHEYDGEERRKALPIVTVVDRFASLFTGQLCSFTKEESGLYLSFGRFAPVTGSQRLSASH